MSENFKHAYQSTMNAYPSSNTNPLSSTIPSASQMRRRDEEEISSCTTFDNISQQEDITRMDSGRGAAIDTITMGHAVRIPQALRSATRRTMLDVLTQLNREKVGNEMDKYMGDSIVEGRRIPHGGVNIGENPYPDHTNTTNTNTIPVSSSSSVVVAPPDLTRSLRHLLPSRRGNAVNARQQCKQQEAQQYLHDEEDSISEFEDDDDDHYNNNNNNNNNQMKKKKKDSDVETRRVQPYYLINEEREVNNHIEQHSFPLTVRGHDEGQRRASHRSWAKLFNCDDDDNNNNNNNNNNLHNNDPPTQDRLHTIQQQDKQKQEEITKCTPVPRISTKSSSRRSSSSLHAVWADVEDERRSSTAGRNSLATLLDAADAEDDERRRSLSYMFGLEKTEERVRQIKEEKVGEEENEENNHHSMHLMSSHTFGKPSFAAMMGLSANGNSSSASAVAALLQGVTSSSISISTTTTTSGVMKRGGGRGRMSAALKQLSVNPTSARVVTYLARSFDDWKLDAASISLLNKETEEKRRGLHSTVEDVSKYALLSETSGVQLKLRVVMIESTYSIYCVRVEIVWADEQTSMELGFSSSSSSYCCHPAITIPSTTTTTIMEEQNEESRPLCTTERNTLWTIALTTPSFQSTPIVVGEYLYLARPFFCYPAIHTIVASLNMTSDAALRQPQVVAIARQGRRRRPREEIYSQQEKEKEQKQQKQEEKEEEEGENDVDNRIRTSYERMSMDTTTPERPSKPPVSLSAPSPFAAYDPFLNSSTSLFQNNTTDINPSVIFSQRGEHVGNSLKMTSEEENNNNNNNNNKNNHENTNTNTSDTSISVNILQGVKHDIIGEHFPRGPGDEWDVPLEVLLALCPIQNHATCASSAANVHNLSPSAIRPCMRNGGVVGEEEEKVSSSISSLSSFDEDDVVPPTLSNQKVSSRKYDDVLLSD